jgi:hypothetical protein
MSMHYAYPLMPICIGLPTYAYPLIPGTHLYLPTYTYPCLCMGRSEGTEKPCCDEQVPSPK